MGDAFDNNKKWAGNPGDGILSNQKCIKITRSLLVEWLAIDGNLSTLATSTVIFTPGVIFTTILEFLCGNNLKLDILLHTN